MQKHHKSIHAVLYYLTVLPLLDYTSVEEKTPKRHLLGVQQYAHVLVGSIQQLQQQREQGPPLCPRRHDFT